MQFYFFAFWGYHNYSTYVFYISLLSSFLSIFLLVSTMNGILSSIMSSNLFLFIFEGYFSCMSILYPLYWRYSQTMSSSLPPSSGNVDALLLLAPVAGWALWWVFAMGLWKDCSAQRVWGLEVKGMTDDVMAGWHHRLYGHEFEWTLEVGDGQRGLACCYSWGRKVRHDWATDLNCEPKWGDTSESECLILSWRCSRAFCPSDRLKGSF